MPLHRVAKRKIVLDLVPIPTAAPTSLQVPRFLQVGDDALHRALGDAHKGSNISHPHLGLTRDAEKHV